jgi:hypothetical protein
MIIRIIVFIIAEAFAVKVTRPIVAAADVPTVDWRAWIIIPTAIVITFTLDCAIAGAAVGRVYRRPDHLAVLPATRTPVIAFGA